MGAVRLALCWLALLLPAAVAQAQIANTATLRYAAADGSMASIRSNTVALTIERAPLASRILLRALPPGIDPGGARCSGGGLVAASVSADQVSLAPARTTIDPTAGFAVLVEAPGSNHDPMARETLPITIAAAAGQGAVATILLTETAPDSGVFAGAVPPAGGRADLAACAPVLTRGERVTLAFAGGEGSLPSSLAAWVDPAGIVFDSADGTPIDGAEVTLLDESGNPARVLGDDGTSAYPATVTSGGAVRDAGGTDYPAVTGRYRFPLVASGRYRLRIVPPAGYTAPSHVPTDALAALRDPAGRAFLLDAASTGGVLTVTGPAPVLTDIPIDRPATVSLLLTLSASLRDVSPGDIVQYRLHLANRGTSTSGPIYLPIRLPSGLRYRPATLHGGAVTTQTDAATLDVTLPALDGGGAADLNFLAAVVPNAPIGEAVVDAQALGTRAVSNAASAAVRIRPLLFTDALTILGRVTLGGCDLPERDRRGVAGARVLLDDGSVAITDREGLYHLEGVRAGRHVVALDAAALPGLTPLDCAADTRSAGSATSRFVEGAGGIVRRVDFQLRGDGRAVAAPVLPIVPLSAGAAAGDRDWLAGQAPGIAWLFPDADYNPRAPVTRVAIRHLPGQRVALTIDGKPVDPLSFDATDSDGKGVAVSRWVGIPLSSGANRLAARVLNADGTVAETLERSVTVSGPAHAAAIDLAHSRLVADGTTPPLVAVRVTDAHGRPVRAGTLVGYAVAAPYAAADTAARPGQPASAPVVGDDGVAFLALRPTGQAGAVRLSLALDDGKDAARPVPVEAWLTATARAWTVVGFGAGSLGRDVLARHAQSLPLAQRGGRTVDGELSLYAKGRIKGAWLLTLAYDSGRRRDPTRGIGGLVDPDRYYTVYGDTALQGADAATQRTLYLRLETPTFLALFGDTDTGLTDAQLTRYSRTVEGFKAEYRGRRWHATAFAARPDTVAGRDEIQGNGLTGPYRLRAQHLVTGSDRVRIEVRDRLRSEVIVATTPLARHLDYTIDPDAGTLRFASPVPSRDPAGNPVFIVAEYEVEGGRAALVAGGRVARRFGRAVEIGASVLRDATLGDGRVAGGDVKVALGATVLRGEVARGGWHGFASGAAFLAEVEHRGTSLDVLAYVRQQDLGFGLGQQNLAEAGTRKIGGDLRWRPLDGLTVSATAWHQQMLAGPGERLAGQARIDWTRGLRTLFVAAQFAEDTGLDGGDRRSRLLTLGARQVLADGALTLEGQADLAPGGEAASVDFPARRLVTATWRLSPKLRLIGGYEIDASSTYTAHSVRAGVEVTPWTGATASAALGGQAAGAGGQRRFVQYGLGQSLPVGPRWSLDATLDSARTVSGAILPAAMVTPFQPVAAAGALGRDAGDFTAASLGASYRDGGWGGRGRIEYRDGAIDRRIGATVDITRAIGEGRSLAAGARAYLVRQRDGREAASLAADVALAWRPAASGWSLLDRLTVRHDHGDPAASAAAGTTLGSTVDLGGGAQATTRAINNLALDWRSRPDGRGRSYEFSLYYGVKYVRGRYADDVAAGFVDAIGFDLRRSLGHRFDIGIAASVEHGWTDRVWAWSGGPSVGLSPGGDMWVSAGYNVAGYRDRDFAGDRYTHGGPYVTLRVKFDARRIAGWLGRRP